jgi:transposase
MRSPAQIEPWLSPEEMSVWIREAPTKSEYQKRLAIGLTLIGPFHARKAADLLQVSVQAVWLWVSQYNKNGPSGLKRAGRGGRRWSFLTWAEEEALLDSLREQAARGDVITAPSLLAKIREVVGREVSLDYVYRLLHRHGWRKLGPRPLHVKADPGRQEDFKKTSAPFSRKR